MSYNMELVEYKCTVMLTNMDDLTRSFNNVLKNSFNPYRNNMQYDYLKMNDRTRVLEIMVNALKHTEEFEEGTFVYENTYRLLDSTIFEINILIDVFNGFTRKVPGNEE